MESKTLVTIIEKDSVYLGLFNMHGHLINCLEYVKSDLTELIISDQIIYQTLTFANIINGFIGSENSYKINWTCILSNNYFSHYFKDLCPTKDRAEFIFEQQIIETLTEKIKYTCILSAPILVQLASIAKFNNITLNCLTSLFWAEINFYKSLTQTKNLNFNFNTNNIKIDSLANLIRENYNYKQLSSLEYSKELTLNIGYHATKLI